MALSLAEFQALSRANLVTFHGQNLATWRARYIEAYSYARTYIVAPQILRQEDVIQTLIPGLEVTTLLADELARKKLRQKYWVRYFADLIVDHFWDRTTMTAEGEVHIEDA